MAKTFPYAEAERLAGEIFGIILDRDADPGGYRYVLHCLESGEKSVKQLVVEFICSDEFLERFVSNRPPAHTARMLTRLMLGRDFENEAESAESTRKFLLQGIKKFVQELAASREYMKEVGSNRLPPLGHQLRPDWLPLDAVEE
jgi:hypothetical protein